MTHVSTSTQAGQRSLVYGIHVRQGLLATCIAMAFASPSFADDTADLAKKTQNPVAALVSLPFQYNKDQHLGIGENGEKEVLNIQPVLPFSLNDNMNLISRTILPLVDQRDFVPGGLADENGVGDVVQSFFFSPKSPTDSGWIWGVGPVLLLPTASDPLLGSEKWGAGPTAVALKQTNGFTVGALFNHISSFAGEDERDDISATFLQPFFSYTTSTYTTFGINTESTYDWKGEEWSVPVNASVTQLLKVGGQIFSVSLGARYWADSTEYGPKDWGYRSTFTMLFPK